jgi:hypothetical protein
LAEDLKSLDFNLPKKDINTLHCSPRASKSPQTVTRM